MQVTTSPSLSIYISIYLYLYLYLYIRAHSGAAYAANSAWRAAQGRAPG